MSSHIVVVSNGTVSYGLERDLCVCESYLPSWECLNEVSECCRVALKESGWLDSYLFALSSFLSCDSGSVWSQFNAAALLGKVGQEEVLTNLALELLILCGLSCCRGMFFGGVSEMKGISKVCCRSVETVLFKLSCVA